MYRIKYFFLIYLLYIPVHGSDLNTVKSIAESVVRHPNLKHGTWSICALDAETGEILLDINSHLTLTPASNMKLITSAAALDILGADTRFHTYLEYDGRIDNGRLNGNLYIRGEGDPTLASPEMPEVIQIDSLFAVWLNALHQKGIKEITGDLIADISYFDDRYIPDDWSWGDMGNYYGPVSSSLCINENSYKLYFKSPAQKYVRAEVLYTDPEIPGISFKNFMLTGNVRSGAQAYIYGAPEQNTRFLHGYIPSGRSRFFIEGSIPDPALFMIQRLNSELSREGISIKGRIYKKRFWQASERHNLMTIASPPLEKIVYRLNKRSNNLFAEQLLKILGKVKTGTGSVKKGIEVINYWIEDKELPGDGVYIEDGSGLARSNGCTTFFFAQLLKKMKLSPGYEAFFNSLSVAGDPEDEGTLKSLCAGTVAAGKVHVKSGLMQRVRSHSGYLFTSGNKCICFSMIANNFSGSYRTIDSLHEKIMVALAGLP